MKNQGFTLLEIMIAVTIISILVIAGGFSYIGSLNKANDAKIISQVKETQKALEIYYNLKGKYPEDLTILASNEYLKNIDSFNAIKDEFYYSNESEGYCLCSPALEKNTNGNAYLGTGEEELNQDSFQCDDITYGSSLITYFCVENSQ
ncbi:type II secretion system protein [Candidatus Beckwithbacteria bacterium]|nr:type II secretion system protein [Candidatus Beckwithbacteria bacterium]